MKKRYPIVQLSGLLEAVVNETEIFLATQDTKFRYTFFNKAYQKEAKRLTGKNVRIGMNMLKLFDNIPEQKKILVGEWRWALKGNRRDKIIEFAGKPSKFYKVFHAPLKDDSGKIIGVGELAFNVTTQVRAERMLRDRERELKELNATLLLAQKSAGIGTWDWNIETGGLRWSTEQFKIFGLDPARAKPSFREWEKIIHPADLDFARSKIDKAIRDKKMLASEYRVVTPDGRIRWISALGNTTYNKKNKPVRMSGVCMDITERKEGLENLLWIERRNSILSKSASELLSADNPKDIIARICKRTMGFLDCQIYFNYLAIPEIKTLSLTAYQGLPEKATQIVRSLKYGSAISGRVAKYGKSIIVNNAQNRKDKKSEAVRSYGLRSYCSHPLLSGGEVLGTISFGSTKRDRFNDLEIDMMKATASMVATAIDKQKSKESLKRSEEHLRQAQEAANVGTWEWDLRTNENIWSDGLWRLYGLNPKKCRASYKKWKSTIHLKDRARVEQQVLKAAAKGVKLSVEWRINDSKKERWVMSRGRPVFDKSGKAVRYIGTVIDITDQKKAEQVLKRDKAKLDEIAQVRADELINARLELDRAKRLSDIGTLAATVAHELRNPLAAISIATYNLKRKANNNELSKHFTNIEKKIDESNQIINNLLFYSRIRPPHYERVNIEDVIREATETILEKNDKKVAITADLEPIKNMTIDADPVQVRELVSNVLNNAFDAVPKKNGKINISVVHTKKFIEMDVCDNGPGIDKYNIEKVFDPFFTTKAKGTGLGLPVCRQMVDMHGGAIKVSSIMGHGTSVVIALPKTRTGRKTPHL